MFDLLEMELVYLVDMAMVLRIGVSLDYHVMGASVFKADSWDVLANRLFLIGLRKFGKGDWRSISRNVVVTRTPTQVASHAQKYFLRHSTVKKERKRSSIHDITTVDTNTVAVPPVDQNWISPPGGSIHPLPPPQTQPSFQQHQQSDAMGYHQNFAYPV